VAPRGVACVLTRKSSSSSFSSSSSIFIVCGATRCGMCSDPKMLTSPPNPNPNPNPAPFSWFVAPRAVACRLPRKWAASGMSEGVPERGIHAASPSVLPLAPPASSASPGSPLKRHKCRAPWRGPAPAALVGRRCCAAQTPAHAPRYQQRISRTRPSDKLFPSHRTRYGQNGRSSSSALPPHW
jgi:hypothetical protein